MHKASLPSAARMLLCDHKQALDPGDEATLDLFSSLDLIEIYEVCLIYICVYVMVN